MLQPLEYLLVACFMNEGPSRSIHRASYSSTTNRGRLTLASTRSQRWDLLEALRASALMF